MNCFCFPKNYQKLAFSLTAITPFIMIIFMINLEHIFRLVFIMLALSMYVFSGLQLTRRKGWYCQNKNNNWVSFSIVFLHYIPKIWFCLFQNNLPLQVIILPGQVTRRYSVKKMFLKISQNSQENTCARVSLLMKLQSWPATSLKKRLWHRRFPVNFEKFLRTLTFIEHLWWLLLYCTMNTT